MPTLALTDEEAVLLSGKVRAEVQPEIDAAAERIASRAALADTGLPPRIAGLVADVVREAKTAGVLVYYLAPLSSCGLCGVRGQERFSGRGRNRRVSYSMRGVELAKRFVHMTGYVALGGCVDCIGKALPYLRRALVGVEVQLPEALGVSRFARHQDRRCKLCGWTGHEGEMRLELALMGGYYPGKCPKCPATDGLFRRDIESLDTFTMVPVRSVSDSGVTPNLDPPPSGPTK